MTVETTATLTLDGNLAQDGFRVTLFIESPDGRRESRGHLPANPTLLQDLTEWRQAYRAIQGTTRLTPKGILYQGAIQSATHCTDKKQDLLSQFSQWLDSPEFSAVDRQLRESLTPHQGLKVLIRAEEWEIHRLPWHQWDFVDRHPQVAIAFSSLTPQSLPPKTSPKSSAERIQILAIFGSSEGLDLSVDRNILNRLPDAEVTQLTEPTRSQLNDALWDQSWDIICFSGHSQTQDQVGRLSINGKDHLTLDELRYGLRQALDKGLKLAVFNSCDGLGLAPDLLALNLPQFIVMGEPVPDVVAHRFLDHFLGAYASGQSLSQAHRVARERLQGMEDDYPCASALPILFENPIETSPSWASLRVSPPASLSSFPAQATPEKLTPARTFTQGWKRIALLGLLGGGLSLGLRAIGVLEPLELRAFDQGMAMRPAEVPDDRLLFITIDDEDIRFQEQQGMQLTGSLAPEALKSLVSKLTPLEPISLGLDIYRSKPLNLAATDQFPIFGICKVPAPDGGDPYGVDPPPDIATPLVGFSDFVMDPDDRIRRQLLAIKNQATTSQCSAQNGLSFLLATHYLQTQGQTYELTANKSLDWGQSIWTRLSPNAGGYRGLDSAGYQMLLNYRAVSEPEAIATSLTLRDVLSDQVPPAVLSRLKQRVILVGNIASSASDRWKTPLHAKSPGVYVQAQMISQLVSSVENGRSLMRWWPEWLEMLWILGWSLGLAVIYWITKKNRVAIALGGIVVSVICYVGFLQALWLPWIPALLGIILTGLLIAITTRKQYLGHPGPRVIDS